MRRFLFLFLIIIFITTNFCKKKDNNKIIEEYKNGIKTVYNPELPLRGEISLRLKEVFKINAVTVDNKNPPGFGEFHKDKNENIYIKDYRNRRILKFDRHGKFLFGFGRKGEGPGEFKSISTFKIFGNKLIVWGSRKFAIFNIDGKFLEEKKLKKYYYPVSIVGEQKFIVSFYKETGNNTTRERFRINALINDDENILSTFFNIKNAGRTLIRKKNFNFSFSSSDITKDIKYAYNDKKKIVYSILSNQYKIYIKNLNGETKQIIERKFENIRIREDDKDKIVGAFNNINDWQKKTIKENLPEKFCVVSSIKSLPEGFILVYAIKGVGEIEMNLFDDQGRFQYIIKYPENFLLYSTMFVDKKLIGIMEGSESDNYIEYEITNYEKIFTSKN